MTASALAAAFVGFSAAWTLWALVGLVLAHNVFVLADSGVLNGGAINAAAPGQAGNTVAAFGAAAAAGGLVGPVIFGIILDRTGGGQTATSWGCTFASLGVAIFVGALAVRLLS